MAIDDVFTPVEVLECNRELADLWHDETAFAYIHGDMGAEMARECAEITGELMGEADFELIKRGIADKILAYPEE